MKEFYKAKYGSTVPGKLYNFKDTNMTKSVEVLNEFSNYTLTPEAQKKETKRLLRNVEVLNHPLSFSVCKITPDVAKDLLATSEGNRRITPTTVSKYAQAIESWKLNGETIIFDTVGHLTEGHHRLHACIKAQQPFVTCVVFGAESRETLNWGRSRTPADGVSITSPELKNIAPLMQATVRLLASYTVEKEDKLPVVSNPV